MGSGCGSVGRAVASNIGKYYIKHLFTVNSIEKTKIKKKRPGMAHLKNHERLNIRLQSTKDMKNRVERELSDVPT